MNKTEDKIFEAFFESEGNKLYFNQIQELTKSSSSSLQNVLTKLEKNKIIKKEKTKSNTYYMLNNKEQKSIEFTKIALNKLNNLNYNVRIPLKEFINLIPAELYTVILFGSTAIRKEKEGSDIDLLIVLNKFENNKLQELYEKEIREKLEKFKEEINCRSIYHLSLFITDKEEFIKNKDFVIKEAKSKGFSIKNQYNYYLENED